MVYTLAPLAPVTMPMWPAPPPDPVLKKIRSPLCGAYSSAGTYAPRARRLPRKASQPASQGQSLWDTPA